MLHTDIPTTAAIRELAELRQPFSVSIYVPTSPLNHDLEVERTELRKQVSEAARQLTEAKAPRQLIARLLSELDELLEDRPFWMHLANTLVVFYTDNGVRTFRLPNDLPPALEVSDRLYLKPLLRAVTFPQAAFVLALSVNSARLIEVSSLGGGHDVSVPDLPHDLATAVNLPAILDRSPSMRMIGDEGFKVRLTQYAQRVDAAIDSHLVTSELPLILAASEPLKGIFRSVNRHPRLLEATIDGSPDERTPGELAAEARPVLDKQYARELAQLCDLFETRFAEGRAAKDLSDVARAATFGAVDTLIVDMDTSVPGTIDEDSGAITFDDSDDAHNYGVVDEIVRRSLLSGARVLVVRAADVPGDGPAAALTRFPA